MMVALVYLLGFGSDEENELREKNRNVLLVLSKVLQEKGYRIEGKKKLMKLMFLVEHYDPETGRLVKGRSIGNEFFIYNYGVFSIDVLKAIDDLIQEEYLKGEYPDVRVETERIGDVKVDQTLRSKIEAVVDRFGKKSGWELERETLNLLGIDYFEKEKYKGLSVEEILS